MSAHDTLLPVRGLKVHVPGWGCGIAVECVTTHSGEQLYKIQHVLFPMVVYRRESQITVLEAPGFHRALINGIETNNPREAQRLMAAHIETKAAVMRRPQYTPVDIRRALLIRDIRITFDVVWRHHRAVVGHPLIKTTWRLVVHHELQRLSIPALPAPQARVLMLPAPEIMANREAEEKAA